MYSFGSHKNLVRMVTVNPHSANKQVEAEVKYLARCRTGAKFWVWDMNSCFQTRVLVFQNSCIQTLVLEFDLLSSGAFMYIICLSLFQDHSVCSNEFFSITFYTGI